MIIIFLQHFFSKDSRIAAAIFKIEEKCMFRQGSPLMIIVLHILTSDRHIAILMERRQMFIEQIGTNQIMCSRPVDTKIR